jgi:hypothetical protein
MILYAKVVMHHLENKTTLKSLKQELSGDSFPADVDKAYVLELC